MTDINVPDLGESVSEATVGVWHKAEGDAVAKDEIIVELETDKVALEVAAPADGVLSKISVAEGDSVGPGAILGLIEAGGAGAVASKPAASTPTAAEPAPQTGDRPVAPSVRRVAAEGGVDPANIPGTGRDGRATKGDALTAVASGSAKPVAPSAPRNVGPREERVRMTRLRQTIATRLKEAQANAAILTTFNDVDMSAIMAIRNQYKETFLKTHGVKLGFMSFFVSACVAALKSVPEVNAEIDGTDIIYKNFYDIGVAVGTEKGLVVPVLRDADQLSLAGVEGGIGALGKKARDGKLAMSDLQGASFTISNGGVYGSMMSTPILNAPQSGILGMHRIEQRPVVVDGNIVIRPMMYLALSYDHRIVDGKGAVTFLVKVKEALEDPQRLLLEL